jgi:PadR family transcriptional regulator AphA
VSYTELMALRYALLGFLSLRPLSGYDLKRLFDTTVQHFWTGDQAQIYRTLAQLAEEGLVKVRVIEQDKRPDRKEHHLTEAGLEELEKWLRSPLEPVPVREPFLLRLFLPDGLPEAMCHPC